MSNEDKRKLAELNHRFWVLIQYSWTRDERADLRAAVEAWMAADKSGQR